MSNIQSTKNKDQSAVINRNLLEGDGLTKINEMFHTLPFDDDPWGEKISQEKIAKIKKQKEQDENDEALTLNKNKFKLFDVEMVKKSINPNSHKNKNHDIHQQLCAHSGYISPRVLPDRYDEIMDEMDVTYPHFKEVTKSLRRKMLMTSLTAKPLLYFGANILLDGPAGIGKSAYLFDLSRKFNTAFHTISCASVSNGFDLVGMSAGWNGGKEGKLHDLLFNQECPNPIIMLDEVEKAQNNSNHAFSNTLYGLLEKNNAQYFEDEFVKVQMDASLINWFATSNESDLLSSPIEDRFEVLSVQAPSADDLRMIVPNIYKKLVSDDGLENVFMQELDEDVITQLTQAHGISLRRINVLLKDALANAVERSAYDRSKRRKVKLQTSDVPSIEVVNDVNSIGFIWG